MNRDIVRAVRSTFGIPIEYDLTWRDGPGFRYATADGYAFCVNGGQVWTERVTRSGTFTGSPVMHADLTSAFADLGWEIVA